MYVRTVHCARLVVHRSQISMTVAKQGMGGLDCHGLDELVRREVYTIPDGKGIGLYCWLSPAERHLLEEPANAEPQRQWLQGLQIGRVYEDI